MRCRILVRSADRTAGSPLRDPAPIVRLILWATSASLPDLEVRVVNVVYLMRLKPDAKHRTAYPIANSTRSSPPTSR